MSHLWVWGWTAYVHVQKDKHTALDPHMEKCVFIGLTIQMATRGGSFITPLPSTQSFLNVLTLMNAISWLLRGLPTCLVCPLTLLTTLVVLLTTLMTLMARIYLLCMYRVKGEWAIHQ